MPRQEFNQGQRAYKRNYETNEADEFLGEDFSPERNRARHYDYSYGRDFMTNRPYGPQGHDPYRLERFMRSRGEHYGKGPKGWRKSDDRIRDDACEALYHDNRIDATDIDVSVKDGVLTLRGNVDSRDTKREAERCVEFISGVEDVQNELRINRESGNVSQIRGRESKEQNRQAQSRSALS